MSSMRNVFPSWGWIALLIHTWGSSALGGRVWEQCTSGWFDANIRTPTFDSVLFFNKVYNTDHGSHETFFSVVWSSKGLGSSGKQD